jgi:hypothetical protein
MSSDFRVYVFFARDNMHGGLGLKATLRSVELFPESDLSFLELIKSQLQDVHQSDLEKDGQTPEKEGYMEWVARVFFGKKDHLKKSNLVLTFKRMLQPGNRNSFMLELKLSDVMKKDPKPQVQSKDHFDWIYFELYNILFVGLRGPSIKNIKEEPLMEQLRTIQRSLNPSHKRIVEELKKCLGEFKAPIKELQFTPYKLSDSWQKTRELEAKHRNEPSPKEWNEDIKDKVQKFFTTDREMLQYYQAYDSNDLPKRVSERIWSFVNTNERIMLGPRTQPIIFGLLFKLLTVGKYLFSNKVSFIGGKRKSEFLHQIMAELTAKCGGLNIDELAETDNIKDLIKHVIDDDHFPTILIDPMVEGQLKAQPILTLLAQKMSWNFIELAADEDGNLVNSEALSDLWKILASRYQKGLQVFTNSLFRRLFSDAGESEDSILKRLNLIWHYFKNDSYKAYLRSLMSDTQGSHQDYCAMVTKVLGQAMVRGKKVEELRQGVIKPYVLNYVEFRGIGNEKVYQIVDGLVEKYKAKELPAEIQRLLFLDTSGIVNPYTAKEKLAEEFKQRYFTQDSVIRKMVEEVFVEKEEYPEYISIDLVLKGCQFNGTIYKDEAPAKVFLDYKRQSTPYFTQMMKLIISLLKRIESKKDSRLQTKALNESPFVFYYQTLTKYFSDEKISSSIRKYEFEQLKNDITSDDDRLRIIDGYADFLQRFKEYERIVGRILIKMKEIETFLEHTKIGFEVFQFHKSLKERETLFKEEFNRKTIAELDKSDFLKLDHAYKTKTLDDMEQMDKQGLIKKEDMKGKTLEEITAHVMKSLFEFETKYKGFVDEKDDKFTFKDLCELFPDAHTFELTTLSSYDFGSDERFTGIYQLFKLTDKKSVITDKCKEMVNARKLAEITRFVQSIQDFELFKNLKGKETSKEKHILAELAEFGKEVDKLKEKLTGRAVKDLYGRLKLLTDKKYHEKLKNLNLAFIQSLANSSDVFQFLDSKGEESISKMANELDHKAQSYTKDLRTLSSKLDFIYQKKAELKNFSEDIFEKLIALTAVDQETLANVLSNLTSSIQTIQDLCLKATGDTKETILAICDRGILYIEFEAELDRYGFYVEIKKSPTEQKAAAPKTTEGNEAPKPIEGNEAPKPIEGNEAPKPIEGNEAPKPIEGNEAPKPIEGNADPKSTEGKEAPKTEILAEKEGTEQTKSVFFSFHDMTSFINIIKDLPEQIDEKGDKEQERLKNAIKLFIKIGKGIQELADLFTNLYNLGIIGTKIDGNFHGYIQQHIIKYEKGDPSKLELSEKGNLKIQFKEWKISESLPKMKNYYNDSLTAYRGALKMGYQEAYMLSFFSKNALYNLFKSIIKGKLEEATISLLEQSEKVMVDKLKKELDKLTEDWKPTEDKIQVYEGAMKKAIKFSNSLKDYLKNVVTRDNKDKEISTKVKIHIPDRDSTKLNEYETILNIFINYPGANNFSRFLFGSKNINELEMEAFLCRALYDEDERFYFIINFKEFDPKVQAKLFNYIREIDKIKQGKSFQKRTCNLIIFDNSSNSQFPLDNDEIYEKFSAQNLSVKKNGLFAELSRITAVLSKNSGGGKTHYIQRQMQKLRKEDKVDYTAIEVSIAGEVNIHTLAKRASKLHELMIEAGKNGKRVFIICKIDYIENFKKYVNIIDYFLFCLCFLGSLHISEGVGILNRDHIKHIFIEIGNSTKAEIIRGIQVVQYLNLEVEKPDHILRKEELRMNIIENIPGFSIDLFEYSDSKTSNEQTACRFLQELKSLTEPELKELNIVPIEEKAVVPEKEFRELLRDRLQDGQPREFDNYRQLKLWIDTLANSYREIEGKEDIFKTTLIKENCDPVQLRIEIFKEIYNFASSVLYFRSDDAKSVQTLIQTYIVDHEKIQELKREPEGNEESKDKIRGQIKQLEVKKAETKNAINKVTPFKWDTKNLIIPLFRKNRVLIGVFSKEVFRVDDEATPDAGTLESRIEYKRFMKRINTKQFIAEVETRKEFPKVEDLQGQDEDIETHSILLAKLCYLLDSDYKDKLELSAKFGSNKGFRITEESYMKILLMLQKSQIKQPIILMGESGCGKTYLSSYLVETILGETLQIICLFAGFSLEDLVKEMRKAIEEAKQLQRENPEEPKNKWIFFDEFNTTAIQAQIADIMLDRVFEGEKLPDNLLFIACCNPYRMKIGGKEGARDIGLVVNQKTSVLSHVVHVVPDRLLDIVWNFGQLTEEDEKHHILSMVRGEKRLFPKEEFAETVIHDYQVKLALVIHRCHTLVRNFEEKSGVSLRDIKRVFDIFIYFRRTFPKMKKEQERRNLKSKNWFLTDNIAMLIGSTICSLHVCYGFRLNGQDQEKDEMFDILYSWTCYLNTFCRLTAHDVRSCIIDVATYFLEVEGFKLDANVSDNVPFKENLIAMLVCINTLTPLIIVGAPGASKTLASQVLLKYLQEKANFVKATDTKEPTLTDKPLDGKSLPGTEPTAPEEIKDTNKKEFTLTDKPLDVRFFAGTELTTPEEIKQVFEKAKNVADVVLGLVFIDELGLAEISERNPLKVLHPYLEEKSRQYGFIGISNWVLDLSKMNRMIFLARPELNFSELMAIFEKHVMSNLQNNEEKLARSLMEGLINAYLKFRAFEKKMIKQNELNKHYYHRDFHGSRDIYGMYNYLVNHWKKVKEEGKQGAMTSKQMLRLLIEAIERNMNGEIFRFASPNEISPDKPLKDKIIEYLNREFMVEKVKRQETNHEEEALVKEKTEADIKEKTEADIKEKEKAEIDEEDGAEIKEKTEAEIKEKTEAEIKEKTEAETEEKTEAKFELVMSSAEVFKALFYNEVHHLDYAMNNLTKFRDMIPDYIMVGSKKDDNKEYQIGNIKETYAENLKSKDSRFMLVRCEGEIVENIFVNDVKQKWEVELKRPSHFHDWRGVGNNDANLSDFLSKLKPLTNTPSVVIMKDLTKMYGGLYDLLNRNFSIKTGKQKDSNNIEKPVERRSCYVYYAGTKQEVEVHENFKIIILTGRAFGKTAEEIQQNYPAPFLNRFEKFFITHAMLANLIPNDKYKQIQSLKNDEELVKLMKNNRFIGLNEDMIISAVDVDKSHKKNTEEQRPLIEALVQECFPEESEAEQSERFDYMNNYFEKNRGLLQLCHMATFNLLFDADDDIRNNFLAISNSKRFDFYYNRVNSNPSQGNSAQTNEDPSENQGVEKSKAIVLTFSPISDEFELEASRLEASTSSISWESTSSLIPPKKSRRALLNLFQNGNRSLNLIIELGSYREFQKLINIRMAIDEINSSAQAKILISKETEKSNSMDQEEKNGSDGDDKTGCSFANVLVIMHLSPHSVELRKLKTLPGLNFWSGWELRVLEKLEMTVNDIALNKNLYRPLPFNELFTRCSRPTKKG